MKSIVAIIVLLATLTGCQTINHQERQHIFMAENDAYLGKTNDELIKGKGVPTGTSLLTDGSKMIEYYNAQVEITGGEYISYPTVTYHPHANGTTTWMYMNDMHSIPIRSWQKICRIDFLINVKNVVESWKYDGKGCY